MTTEAEKRASEYCVGTVFTDETGNGETLIYNMRFMAFLAGFIAGQQSQWRKYPDERPDNGGRYRVVIDRKIEDHAYWDEIDCEWYFPSRSISYMVTHWMPITLPETKEQE